MERWLKSLMNQEAFIPATMGYKGNKERSGIMKLLCLEGSKSFR